MKRRNLVALRDIIGVAGDKDDLHRLIMGTDFLCHGHAVHSAHFNIQEQNVPLLVLGITEQEALRRSEYLRLNGRLLLPCPICQNALNKPGIRHTVINNRHAIRHGVTFFHKPVSQVLVLSNF